MALPNKSILRDLEGETYAKHPKKYIKQWGLLYPYSKGIKAYLKDDVIVVAIRGTADVQDMKAVLRIVNGTLYNSKRYKEDVSILLQIQQSYPKRLYNYFGVSHSLGGAILDQFLNDGLIIKGVSFNPAVEFKYLKNKNNMRIYHEDDPLYNTIGRFASNIEVRKNKSMFKKVFSLIPFLPKNIVISLRAHLLNNFEGGIQPSIKNYI
jgi:hypothetical protein